MAEQEHTAGEWRYEPRAGLRNMRGAILASGSTPKSHLIIAHVDDVDGFSGSTQANAALIAAAPDSHAANKRALYWLEHPAVHYVFRADPALYERLNNNIECVRAAIAKAQP